MAIGMETRSPWVRVTGRSRSTKKSCEDLQAGCSGAQRARACGSEHGHAPCGDGVGDGDGDICVAVGVGDDLWIDVESFREVRTNMRRGGSAVAKQRSIERSCGPLKAIGGALPSTPDRVSCGRRQTRANASHAQVRPWEPGAWTLAVTAQRICATVTVSVALPTASVADIDCAIARLHGEAAGENHEAGRRDLVFVAPGWKACESRTVRAASRVSSAGFIAGEQAEIDSGSGDVSPGCIGDASR